MGIRSGHVVLAAALVAVLGAGCASNTAPKGFLDSPHALPPTVRGGWVTLRYTEDLHDRRADGELLAVHEDSVYVLTEQGFRAVSRKGVRSAKVTGYAAEKGGFALWTLVGTLSTASHGFGLVISAPVWILVGSVTTAAESSAPDVPLRSGWARMRAWSRYPQGLPPALDRASLRL